MPRTRICVFVCLWSLANWAEARYFVVEEQAGAREPGVINDLCQWDNQLNCRITHDTKGLTGQRGELVGEEPSYSNRTLSWWPVRMASGERYFISVPNGHDPLRDNPEVKEVAFEPPPRTAAKDDPTANRADAFIVLRRVNDSHVSVLCRMPQTSCSADAVRQAEGLRGVTEEQIEARGSKYWKIRLQDGSKLFAAAREGENSPVEHSANGLMPLEEFYRSHDRVGTTLGASAVKVEEFLPDGRFGISGLEEPVSLERFRLIEAGIRLLPDPADGPTFIALTDGKHMSYDRFDDVLRIGEGCDAGLKRRWIALELEVSSSKSRAIEELCYYGDSWLFVSRYTILAGGQRFDSPTQDFKRTALYGDGIKEWRRKGVSNAARFDLLEAIGEDVEAAVRFRGKDFYADHHFTPEERAELRQMLALRELFAR